ncbi:hypothetical protein CYY_007070 [Polysphondylium violaceum]|uniref:Ankyrin repeat-containing protein n=1 Tax=Polysphondylium violaceum TaxID=133409 RepID=A0A8J4PP63_9MYCE|nr:hypothetical protein CYY_007070 [Polysphondylium violaceum]
MEVFFKQVFFNSYIRDNIYYYVSNDVNCKMKSYRNCFDVGWMIDNKLFDLLRIKLRNNEYLVFNTNAFSSRIFQLDVDLYLECRKRLMSNNNNKNPWGYDFDSLSTELTQSAAYSNQGILKYYLEKEENKHHYTQYYFGIFTKMNDIGMVKQYLGRGGCFDDEIPYFFSIQTKNTEMIKIIFDAPRNDLAKEALVRDKEELLVKAMKTLDLDIFKLVVGYFDIDDSSSGDKIILWKLLKKSMQSFHTLKYIIENYGASVFSLDISSTINPEVLVTTVASRGNIDSINYLIDRSILGEGNCGTISYIALVYGHLELYEFIQNKYNLPLAPAPISFHFSKMINPPKTVEKVQYLFETLEVTSHFADLDKASLISLDVYMYIHGRLNPFYDQKEVEKILTQALNSKNVDIILFLHRQGQNINSVVPKLLKRLQIKDTAELPSLYHLIQQLFPFYLSAGYISNISNTLATFIEVCGDFDKFKYLFDLAYKWETTDKVFLSHLYPSAAKAGRNKVIQYLYQHGIQPNEYGIYKLILEATAGGSLPILKTIIDNFQDKESLASKWTLEVVYLAIKNDRLACLEYLVPMIPSQLFQNLNLDQFKQLNLYMVQYLHHQFSNHSINFIKILKDSIINGDKDFEYFLIEKGIRALFVFFNNYIRKNIFYQVKYDVNYKTRDYENCFDVEWMVEENLIELLKLKLKGNERLVFHREDGKSCIFKIKELDVFIQCFQRILKVSQKRFIDTNIKPLLCAARYDNLDALKYLIEKQGYKISYCSHPTLLLEYFTKRGDVALVREYLAQVKYVVSKDPFLNSIDSKNIDLIKLVFNAPRKREAKSYFENDAIKILVRAMESLDLEVFTLIRKYIEKSISKGFLAIHSILWQLFSSSTKSFHTFKYMIDNFDLSFTSLLPHPYTLNCHPFERVVSYGNKNSLKYLMDSCIDVTDHHLQRMSRAALIHGHFELYQFLEKFYNILSPLHIDFQVSQMSPDIPLSIDKLKYLYETLKVVPDIKDLERAVRNQDSVDVYKYIHERLNLSYTSDLYYQTSLTRSLELCKFEIPLFIYQKGVKGEFVWTILTSLKPTSQTFDFIQQLLKLSRPNNNHIHIFIATLHKFIKATSDFRLFKGLFHIIEPMVNALDKNNFIIEILYNASKACRYQIVKYLCQDEDRFKLEVYINLVEHAAENGSIQIIKYIIENYFDQEAKLFLSSKTNILEKAILKQHLDCVQYLMPMYSHLPQIPLPSILNNIALLDNILMIEYLCSIPQFKNSVKLFKSLNHSKINGLQEICQYLEKFAIDNRQEQEQDDNL